MAPKARIISLKVLDRNGAGYTSSVLRALEFVVENRDKLKIDIVNLSLGHPIYESPETDPLVRAVEDAVRAGIVVVAAAGNYGLNLVTGVIGYAGIASPATRRRRSRSDHYDMHDTADRADDSVAAYSSARTGVVFRSREARPRRSRSSPGCGRGVRTRDCISATLTVAFGEGAATSGRAICV